MCGIGIGLAIQRTIGSALAVLHVMYRRSITFQVVWGHDQDLIRVIEGDMHIVREFIHGNMHGRSVDMDHGGGL